MEINLKKKHWLILISFLTEETYITIKFVDDFSSIILEAKRKVAEEEPETEPSKPKIKKKSPLELHEDFVSEIKNNEKKCK